MNWYNFASLIVGYMLAALFSSHVSMAVSLTVWGSLWTYVVIAFWWFIAIFVTWLIPAVLFGSVWLAVIGVLTALIKLFEWKDRR